MSTLSIRTRRWTRKSTTGSSSWALCAGRYRGLLDRQPGGSCPRGLSPAGPRGVSALRLEVPQRTGAEARGERLAARRPDRTDRRRRSAAVGRASPQAPLNPRAAARRPNGRETMMRVAELWRYPVKSLAGERLERAELTVEGIAGDRVVHVRDARGRVITSRTHPKLLGLRATLGPDGEPRIGGRPWASEESAAAVREAAGPEAVRRAAAPRRHRRRDRGARRGWPPAPSEHPRRGRRGLGRARVAGPASQDRRRAHRGREAPRSVRDDDVRPRHAGAGPLRTQADRRGVRREDGPRLRRSRERRPTGRW